MEHQLGYYLRRRNLGNFEYAEACEPIPHDAVDRDAAFEKAKAIVHRVLELPPVKHEEKPAPPPETREAEALRHARERQQETLPTGEVNRQAITKTEVVRICEPPEPAARPLRHIRKAEAVAQVEQSLVDMGAAEPVPSASEVQTAFAKTWQRLGGTSVQTVRLKALLAEFDETDHTKVSPENRVAFLRALETMK